MGRWTVALAIALATIIAACTNKSEEFVEPEAVGQASVEPAAELPVVFSDPFDGLTDDDIDSFSAGQIFFDEMWTPVGPAETGNDGLGPLFNTESCAVPSRWGVDGRRSHRSPLHTWH